MRCDFFKKTASTWASCPTLGDRVYGRMHYGQSTHLVAVNESQLQTEIRYDGQFNSGYDTHTLTGRIKIPLN